MKLCSTCEYAGQPLFPVYGEWYKIEKNGSHIYARKLTGYSDRISGQAVDYPMIRCDNPVYRQRLVTSEAPTTDYNYCPNWTARSWSRPRTCGECTLKTVRYNDGSFMCSGMPFTDRRHDYDLACDFGKSIKLISVTDIL